jgi:hypothetical protein
MADDEEKRKKKKGGLFGRKKKKKDAGETSFNSSDSNPGRRKKKPGFGRRIKRIVGGRKRSRKAGDDDSDVGFLDKDDPNYKGPRTSLDPSILAQLEEDDDPNTPRGGRFGQGGVGGPLDSAIEEESDDDVSLMSYGEVDGSGRGDEPGDLMFPVALVLLLVDPETLRFELLQLDLETPQEAKVSDVLDQIKESVTEPAIRSLEFHGLVDRKGNQFAASAALAKALTNRKRNKDILVGLSKGVTTEHCGRLARPILGDSKVISMVRARISEP